MLNTKPKAKRARIIRESLNGPRPKPGARAVSHFWLANTLLNILLAHGLTVERNYSFYLACLRELYGLTN